MAIKTYPVKFEAYDEINEAIFKIEAEDDACASVEITSPVTVELWREISKAIEQCLIDMKLGE